MFIRRLNTTTPDTDPAIDAREKILAIDPRHEQTLNQLGRLLSKAQERPASRIVDLMNNLEDTPNPALLVYQILSGYHCHQENWSQAHKITENGLPLYPQAHSLKNNLA